MTTLTTKSAGDFAARLRRHFVTRDFIYNDGRDLKRFSVTGRAQAAAAGVAAVTLGFSLFGVASTAVTAAGVLTPPNAAETKMATMQAKLQAMQTDVASIKRAAEEHARRVEQRQRLISAVMAGKRVANLTLDYPTLDAKTEALAADVTAPLRRVEARQLKLAQIARQLVEARYAATAGHLRQLGIAPERLASAPVAEGGPYEPVASAAAAADIQADAQFRSLFTTWKKYDTLQQGSIAIPTIHPVANLAFTSNYGVRTDPFRGTAAFHPGVDIPGPIGTPVYATADGVVDRAERAGGYGNLIELDHGKGIQTRYGHLSKILVASGAHITRGQLIGLIGSTGRSTGPHLHYEVRIDGRAVNPVPFLQTADYMTGVARGAIKPEATTAGDSAIAD